MATSIWHFPDPRHLTSRLQLVKDIDNAYRMTDNVKHLISRSALKFEDINTFLLIKCFIFSTRELFTRLQLRVISRTVPSLCRLYLSKLRTVRVTIGGHDDGDI